MRSRVIKRRVTNARYSDIIAIQGILGKGLLWDGVRSEERNEYVHK